MRFGVALCRAYGSSNAFYLGVRYKKRTELTGIEVMAGAGKRLQLFIMSPRQQLEGGLYLNKYFI